MIVAQRLSGIELQRKPKVVNSRNGIPFQLQSHTQIVVGFRIIGPESHRFLELHQGVIDLAFSPQSRSEGVARFGVLRVDLDRAPELLNRGVDFTSVE